MAKNAKKHYYRNKMNPNKKQTNYGRYEFKNRWLVTTKQGKILAKFRYKVNALEFVKKQSGIYFGELEVQEVKNG